MKVDWGFSRNGSGAFHPLGRYTQLPVKGYAEMGNMFQNPIRWESDAIVRALIGKRSI